MAQVSIPLAIYDFVPVAISVFGLGMVARIVGETAPSLGRWATLGVLLVVAGGLSRALWKLIVASGGPDIPFLHGSLYVLLAAGFLLLGTAVWWVRSGRPTETPGAMSRWMLAVAAFALVLLGSLLLGQASGRLVPLALLLAATLGVALVSIGLFARARHLERSRLAWAFLAYLLVTLALNGFARASVQTETLQWIEQTLNALNQVILVVAASALRAGMTSPDAAAGFVSER